MRRSLRMSSVRLIAALAAFALLPSFTTAQAAVAPASVQFATPLFGMAFMVHMHKQLSRRSPQLIEAPRRS